METWAKTDQLDPKVCEGSNSISVTPYLEMSFIQSLEGLSIDCATNNSALARVGEPLGVDMHEYVSKQVPLFVAGQGQGKQQTRGGVLLSEKHPLSHCLHFVG